VFLLTIYSILLYTINIKLKEFLTSDSCLKTVEPKEAVVIEVKRFLGLSAMEWTIFLLGIGGMAALWMCFPALWWKIFCAGFGLAFLFESSMEPLFTYHPQLSQRHCIKNTDVNFFFPFGWLSVAGWTAFIAEKFIPLPAFPAYLIAAFFIGNAHEFLFFHFKFWTYNCREPMMGKFRPFVPVLLVFGVPVQVVIGYCNVGIMTYFLIRILF